MPAATAVASRIAGRFVLESLAGAGGMGAVYRARDEASGRTVALKLLSAAGKPHEIDRFVREAEVLAELHHPGIVGYLAHGATEAGEPYLAMEWLEGEDLSRRLARGELSLPDSLTLLRRAAEGLALAHARGVVHRDLKPSNLLLRDGDVDRVALLDFGIARLAARSHVMTRTGVVMGTPGYMAPEQARGERDVGPAADVFSLGCVLFECLTGKAPFAADHVMAVLARIVFDEPPRLRQVRPGVPAAVEALLGRMLAKDPEARLPDAAALIGALDALDGAGPAPAPTPAPAPSGPGEQLLLSVLMAAPPPGASAAPIGSDATIAGDHLVELHRELSDQGARIEVLADGSLVAALRDLRGAATDQAARAARCALSIRARWPEALIAIGTGSGLVGDRAPAGEAFARAAALLRDHAAAPPSERILLDEVTRGLLEVRFRIQRAPGGAYTLTGEEVGLDASRPLLGRPTPCVGRDAELGTLESALSACVEEGEPRAVLVIAPPGAGKSRLWHELLRRALAREDAPLVLIGRGDPMSAGSSYGLIGQALRRLCGILDGEGLTARRDKLGRRLGERVPEADRGRVIAFLGELSGVPLPDADDARLRAARQDPQLMSDQVTQAMIGWLRAECAARPVLIVLEDLHWGDAPTVRLVEAALRALTGSPLMVLALARPEVNDLFPRLWPTVAQVVPLRPLGKRACERLVRQVLGGEVPGEAVARIVAQSEGNALFLEELIRSAAEGRGGEAPATVLATLQARIGRLPAGARRVLRAASVFGETTWIGGIEALIGGAEAGREVEGWLARLTQDEILEARPESRLSGERELRFRHALMRDAVYGLLTADERVEAHRIAGAYLEGRGEADALVLAEHFLQGGEVARAIDYFTQAADQLYDVHAIEATHACAARGLACGAQGEARGALLALQAAAHARRHHHADAIALGAEALRLLPEGSRRWCLLCGALFPTLIMSQYVPLLEELRPRFARVEPSAEARGEYVRAAAWLINSLISGGRKDAARALLERARQVGAALDRSDRATSGFLRAMECAVHDMLEEAPWSRLVTADEGRELLRIAGDRRTELLLLCHRGKSLQELGDRAGAEATLREALALAERLQEAMPLTFAQAYLARLLSISAPLAALDEPADLAGRALTGKNVLLVGMARGALAEARRRRGDLDGAEAEARAACEAARPFPAYSWEPLALRVRILLALGRAAEARSVGEAAVEEMDRLGLAGWGELALRLALAEARHAAGEVDAARAVLADAIPRLERRAGDIPEAAARARYLNEVPVHARLLALAEAWR